MEKIIPQDYYTQGMIGISVDERVLSDLISQRLPKIFNHLQKYEFNLHGFITSWFMCLYVNILPLEVPFLFLLFFYLYLFIRIIITKIIILNKFISVVLLFLFLLLLLFFIIILCLLYYYS